MAHLVVNGEKVRLELSLLEILGAFHKPPEVDLSEIESIEIEESPWVREVLKGVRAPGTGIPFVVMLGTMRYLQGKDFVVLGINQGESAEKVKSKIGMFSPDPTFPLLVDARSEVGAYFKVNDLPTTLIFNKQGILTGVADGARDFTSANIRKNIEDLLAQ